MNAFVNHTCKRWPLVSHLSCCMGPELAYVVPVDVWLSEPTKVRHVVHTSTTDGSLVAVCHLIFYLK
jgi:hypothetical protein